MYFDQLLLAARQVHAVYSDQLLGAAHYIHFISNHNMILESLNGQVWIYVPSLFPYHGFFGRILL